MVNLMRLSRYELGKIGEKLARFIIREKTNLDSVASSFGYGDLLLSNGLFIEVKTIRQNKDQRYLATVEKRGSQHLGCSHYVLLQVVKSDDIIDRYLIPAYLIKSKRINAASPQWQSFKENYAPLLNYAKSA